MESKRNYQGKDVDMLTTCVIIIENALANQDFLISKRKTWEPPFFDKLKDNINTVIEKHLGLDNAAQMRKATKVVIKIQSKALYDLAEFKIQIQEDFKADKQKRDEILKILGFTDFLKMAQDKDQEALIQLLYCFTTNLEAHLRTEIVEKGMDETTIDNILSYAQELSTANISQETFKGTRKIVTQETITEFNATYDEVISVAKIARNFFKEKPSMQDLFSYNKILKSLNFTPKPGEDDKPEDKE